MNLFRINDNLSVVCERKKTRIAFKHTAVLLRNGIEIDTTKICYQNRTWERYTYESVLEKLFEQSKKYLTGDEIVEFKTAILEGDRYDKDSFKSVVLVAKLGDILCKEKKEKNDWKTRMLKAGLEGQGLEIPEDWETLDEDTKEARLNGALAQLGK